MAGAARSTPALAAKKAGTVHACSPAFSAMRSQAMATRVMIRYSASAPNQTYWSRRKRVGKWSSSVCMVGGPSGLSNWWVVGAILTALSVDLLRDGHGGAVRPGENGPGVVDARAVRSQVA